LNDLHGGGGLDDPFEYEVQRRVPDATKAREVLGFEATTSLDEMLDEVIPWVTRAVKERPPLEFTITEPRSPGRMRILRPVLRGRAWPR
jgi:hypothetical protein